MKRRFSDIIGFLIMVCLAGWAVAARVLAQTPGEIAITREGTRITLSWDSVEGKSYQLISTTKLGSPWQEVETQPRPLVAASNRLSYTLNLAEESQFYRVAELGEFVPAGMVWIPPGTFIMGSPTNEVDRHDWEGPQTAVTISRGIWMGKYEVNQGEYEAVMGNNPSSFTGDMNRPVDTVSWPDAVAYCAALTDRERASGRIPTNFVYRLPTEAEWEYACRAGTSTRFSYGDDLGYTNLTNYAWYQGNSGSTTHPVGQKLPNPWGLYDMHGNVWEWCHDWWFGSLPGGIALDPQGPTTGFLRVLRGGYWSRSQRDCRSAIRSGRDPVDVDNRMGFRTVLGQGQP